MLKREQIFYALLSLFISLQLFSQDTLVLRNGESIPVKIIKVQENSVKLKKSNELSGPYYFYQNEEISFIKYHDGIVDYYDLTKKPRTTSKYYFFPKITYSKRKFFLGSNLTDPITDDKVLAYAYDLSNEKNIIALKALVAKTELNDKRKTVFSTIGGVTMGVGLGALGLGLIWYDRVSDPSAYLYGFGSVAFGIGSGFTIVAIINGINKQKRTRQTIDLYNKSLGYQ